MVETLLLAVENSAHSNPDEKNQFTVFKSWIENRKIKSSDLVFLGNLQQQPARALPLLSRVCLTLGVHNPTFSEGLKLLETAWDLILMGHDESLFEKTNQLSEWQGHLKVLRYPHTTGTDEQLKLKLTAMPWPYGAKVKFERRGDRAGVELKTFITSEADVTKIIAALERVKEQL